MNGVNDDDSGQKEGWNLEGEAPSRSGKNSRSGKQQLSKAGRLRRGKEVTVETLRVMIDTIRVTETIPRKNSNRDP